MNAVAAATVISVRPIGDMRRLELGAVIGPPPLRSGFVGNVGPPERRVNEKAASFGPVRRARINFAVPLGNSPAGRGADGAQSRERSVTTTSKNEVSRTSTPAMTSATT